MKTNCIMCPLGCELTITKQKNGEVTVVGNTCVRGLEYGKNEIICPKRTISTLIKYNGGVVPVKTSGQIPKDKIKSVLEEIGKVKLNKKPKFNDIIIKNILSLNIDIVCIGY